MCGVEMAVVGQALDVADGGVTLQLLDVRKPGAAVRIHDVRNELFESFTSIADKSGVYLDVLVDFSAVDFDVNLASALRIGAQVAGDAVIEAHADGDEQVGLLNGVIDPSFAVHAHHAEVHGIGSREAADAEKRHGDGNI